MDDLFIKHLKKITAVSADYQREITGRIDWNDRIIGIGGQRGVGKTTLLLQYIKKHYKTDKSVLYVSMDDLYFSANRLIDFAEQFSVKGGKQLFLDEIHRYPNWAQEIKNIYDDFPELNIVFTGSSMLEISRSKADLSRRVAYYNMPGMSFREYVNSKLKKTYPALELTDILNNHSNIAISLKNEFMPLVLFSEYLQHGYFPFYKEVPKTFLQRVEEIINTTFDVDIMQLKGLNTSGLIKMKRLLYVIAQSVPFKPNIVKLSERIGVNRNTLLSYIRHLEDAGIITSLYASAQGIGILQKPEKIYLENTCFNYALSVKEPEIGTLRETFFLSHLKEKHRLSYTEKGDFVIDEKHVFEVGGRSKGMKQVKGIKSAWIAADDLEIGIDQKIPLWLLGFIY
ncbi:MAG TPA: AAA family ATPase [Tenuifilaceae bacterium]|nr:AAA family ATPase [Tenuifilaceae bacterium]